MKRLLILCFLITTAFIQPVQAEATLGETFSFIKKMLRQHATSAEHLYYMMFLNTESCLLTYKERDHYALNQTETTHYVLLKDLDFRRIGDSHSRPVPLGFPHFIMIPCKDSIACVDVSVEYEGQPQNTYTDKKSELMIYFFQEDTPRGSTHQRVIRAFRHLGKKCGEEPEETRDPF